MRAVVLGTGTSSGVPIPTCRCEVCTSTNVHDKRLRTSVWLQWDGASVLIDTSADFREQALRNEIPSLDAVLYTHAHADHILGLDDLRPFNWQLGGAMPAYASADTIKALRRTFWYVFEDDGYPSVKPALDLQEIDRPFDLLGKRIVPIPVDHGPQRIFGFRVERFAYLTDVSEIPEQSMPLLEDLDTLILSALRDRPHPTHLTLEAAVELAQRIGARQTWFTHLGHELGHDKTNARLPEGISVAWDGLVIDFQE